MKYLYKKEWLKNLTYEDLIYLCARNEVEWFPHHNGDKLSILNYIEELDYHSLNNGYRLIEELYKNRGLLS